QLVLHGFFGYLQKAAILRIAFGRRRQLANDRRWPGASQHYTQVLAYKAWQRLRQDIPAVLLVERTYGYQERALGVQLQPQFANQGCLVAGLVAGIFRIVAGLDPTVRRGVE